MRKLILGVAVAVTSMMPVVGMADDQQIAEFVKSRLKSEQDAGNLKGFNVDMRVEDGTVWFDGFVSNADQQMMILRTAQEAGHLGVIQVVDDIEVKAKTPASPYKAAAYEVATPPAPKATQAAYGKTPTPSAPASYARQSLPVDGYVESYNEPMPFASCGTPAPQGVPIQAAPVPAGYGGQPVAGGNANLPGYAWPAYAAAPNYGAVSYPKQHSASAWPYIGPFYPYPQVPLGWRKVTLEWDDGWWNLDFHDK